MEATLLKGLPHGLPHCEV